MQKLPINRNQTKGTPVEPNRDTKQPAHPPTITITKPIRAMQQHHPTISIQNNPNTAENIPATILIELDTDHNVLPEEAVLTDNNAHQKPPPTESTRIGDNEINISIEHSLSDDERCKIPEQIDSPHSSYSTAPSEIPDRPTQEQSPISSLDPEDIEQFNTIFDI